MASKRTTRGSRSAVIRCPNCGEDYSVTYKRCPFCDEKADKKPRAQEGGEDQGLLEEGAARGGKRLLGGGRRGGGLALPQGGGGPCRLIFWPRWR